MPDASQANAAAQASAEAAQTSDAAADKAEGNPVKYSFKGNRGGKPTNSNRLSYPHEKVYDNHTDYVKFTFVKYKPPFASLKGTEFVNKKGKVKPLNSDQALNLYNNSIGEFGSAGLPSIYMYMPEDIGAEYGAQWGGKGFTNTGADAMRIAGGGLNSAGFLETAGTTMQTLGNAMTRGQALIAGTVASALNALPGKIGGSVNANDVLGGVGGVILNPNVELLFSGFELRNFGLNFKMAPRSAQEALVIRDIITTFKRASLPHFGASPGNTISNAFKKDADKGTAEKNNNRNFIGVPNLCIVEFMKGKQPHPYLTQYKPCAIRNVNVTYTPDGQYSTYRDGSPVATGLTLSFVESKLVYSNEISYGGVSY